MSRVSHMGYGVYCYSCVEVHESTDDCDHDLGDKAGVQRDTSGDYYAQPDSMGHHGPHMFIEVDGMEMCAECEHVKIPEEMVESQDGDRDE